MNGYQVITSDHTRSFPRSHAARSCVLCGGPRAPHFNRKFYAMPVQEAIIELLRISGPCRLDDVVTYLPDLSWREMFRALDRMSRDGLVVHSQLAYSTY